LGFLRTLFNHVSWDKCLGPSDASDSRAMYIFTVRLYVHRLGWNRPMMTLTQSWGSWSWARRHWLRSPLAEIETLSLPHPTVIH